MLPIMLTPIVETPTPPTADLWVIKRWDELTGVDALRLNANGVD